MAGGTVFWKNPVSYVRLAATFIFEWSFRVVFALYGKKSSDSNEKNHGARIELEALLDIIGALRF